MKLKVKDFNKAGKKLVKKGTILYCIGLVLLMQLSCDSLKTDYTKLVNVFIGSQGEGNTYPGATYPFGAVQLSPDTGLEGPAHTSYKYNHNSIIGFSHTHLNGVGEPEYRDILVMPGTGDLQWNPGSADNPENGYRSRFSHDNEEAYPGYYSVLLEDYNVQAELTSTLRAGFHRYTFPKSDQSHIIFDLEFPGGDAEELLIHQVSDNTIQGLRRSHGWAYNQYVFFYAEFSKPFKSILLAIDNKVSKDALVAKGKNVKAAIHYDTKEGEQILVKVGISAVSMDGAKKNLEQEIPHWNFDKTVKECETAWNKELSRIDIEGGTPDQRTFFYTSMYNACKSPDIYMDVDGRYRGIDGKIHQANGFTNYTVFSLWDTFRALHPLLTIIDQERTNEFIKALLQKYEDGGRLPMWALAGNYTDDMLGYHSVPVIADAYMKGIRDYDVKKAFEAVKHSAELDKLGLKYYKKIGYLPFDRQGESVSKTLEYCYNDWCISQMAQTLGTGEEKKRYHQRAHFYKNVFDKSTDFMRGKSLDREWLAPFDPLLNSAYSEGNAYQYMFVPHDIEGLIAEMGGDAKFSSWLDKLFHLEKEGGKTGFGQYEHGNEPSHHLAYLYNFTGEAWKTQRWVSKIVRELHPNAPLGLSGNDDCGQMSAWYILSSMGFYSVTPGQDIYVIGSPLFPKTEINLENGNTFTVRANGVSDNNIYIQSASLNGNPYTKTYIRHEDIMSGSELVFEMGPEPNKEWGKEKADRPYSKNGNAIASLPYIRSGETLFSDHTTIELDCDTEGAEIRYTLDGTEPTKNSQLYGTAFILSESSILKMRSFHPNMESSIVIEHKLQKASPYPASTLLTSNRKLTYRYFERFFVTTEDMDGLKPLENGLADKFTIDKAKLDNYFGFEFNGYIRVPKDGIYTFYLASNDGSRMFINSQEIIENDANHGSIEEQGKIALQKGFHSIRVRYFQCGGGKGLKASWSGPGFEKEEIPGEVLWH